MAGFPFDRPGFHTYLLMDRGCFFLLIRETLSTLQNPHPQPSLSHAFSPSIIHLICIARALSLSLKSAKLCRLTDPEFMRLLSLLALS